MKVFSISLFFVTLLSLSMTMHAQGPVKNYDAQWKNVAALEAKNLPKSALVEVKKIYDLAKKEKQDAQLIKSLIYISHYQEETRENNEILSIKDIEKEISAAQGKEPVLALLNSLLAGMYYNYYQSHRWEFYNRTQTTDFKKDDIATWAAEDFHKKISELYLRSIKEEKILQQTKLETFDAIIVKGNVRHLRPTLFDVLSNTALVYFQNDERDINKPAYAFEIDQASAFDPAADFITRKFPTKDSLSLYHKALLLYQKLIAFHSNDAKPDALLDIDLKRIQFVNSKSVHPDKDQLYFNSINHIAHQYGNTPAAAQAWYLVAQYYQTKGNTYKAYEDSTHRLDLVKAKEICEKVIAQKDSSEGKVNCMNLLATINQPALHFIVEKVNIPGQAFRASVQYKNINRLYLRIIKPTDKLRKELEAQYNESFWSALINASVLKSWDQALPATTDLQTHLTEIKVDALPAGDYFILASTEKDFTNKKAILGSRIFYVSNISFINNLDDAFVLNRDNGQPLAGTTVQFWEQRYDYSTSKNIKVKTHSYKTDANGFFKMQRGVQNNNRYRYNAYQLEITYGNERLFMDDNINDYSYSPYVDEEAKAFNRVFLFADRSLYRPGQIVYFKGITMTKNNKENKADILSGYETTIYLRDANAQNIDSIKVKTNEFGSFTGKFQLPEGALNGQFSLITSRDEGFQQFRVEEYKRPKFYVDYEPLKGTYKVNDQIKMTGTAKAYAGNNIDGATVKYRVVRQPRYIYYWYFAKSWQPPTEPQEIAHGELTTDKDGKFIVEFTAIPDGKIAKQYDPVFDYTVYADVTDINGETRSGQQLVSVSYKALLLKTTIPSALPVDSLRELFIRTENMNGEFEPANVKVTFTKLKEEKRLIRERLWERPDQFVFTKEEYVRNFPNDEYDNETDPESWEKGEKALEKTDSAKATGEWLTGARQWAPGYYVIEISTKDKNGEEVKDVKYIELYDEKSNQLSRPQYIWSAGSDPIEPGQTTAVKLGSSADNLFVIQDLDKSHNMVPVAHAYSFIKINQEKRSISFTATEADRGGYGATWLFVKHNRVYQRNEIINVPWTNKELTIEYATYRDKTLPGSEEKWKLKISGYKNEKVAAEMLASMYDASLDQFYPHAWDKPYIWLSYSRTSNWNGNQNFTRADATPKQWIYPAYKSLIKNYDYTIFDNNSIMGYFGYGSGDKMLFKSSARNEKVAMAAPVMQAAPALEKKQMMREETSIAFDTVTYPDADGDGKADAADQSRGNQQQDPAVQIRKNFNETAFFIPDLKTDSDGSIEFSFTLPDALTKWKFQALAHTKGLAFGYSSKEIVTQKQLMVQPNAPRFLREGDKMEFSSKIVNLTDKELTGQAELQLVDATTNKPVDGWFKNVIPNQYFTIAAGQSQAVNFPIEIPYRFSNALVWRIVAKAGEFSDGEENAMPVLTNRMLVTETLPLWMRGDGTKNFSFDKLLNSGKSETLQQYAVTVEYTSNPAWYAVQALPYLMEYPYDCAEQTWNRYYANSLATSIANSSPRIKEIFSKWAGSSSADAATALMSNLQKNQELKAVLLEETPWVLQAKTETEQKKNIALLFDMVRMSKELNSAYEKLKQLQSSNGGFVWFKGGPDDRFMTQYIVTGIGHLKKLNSISAAQDAKLKTILAAAIPYLDKKIKEDYDELVRNKTDLKIYEPDYSEIQYLYMRSFFPEYKIAAASQTAYTYFRGRVQLTWAKKNKYMEGMIALALNRTGDTKTPVAILKSLKETSISNEEMGMYWKDASRGWWWYEAPIERQALMIEAFQEISKDTKTVDDLRTWLLKNKQTNNWESTKATAEACYALLLKGTEWLSNAPAVTINLGTTVIRSTDEQQEAGTGYMKKTIEGEKVNPAMGSISVKVESSTPNAAGSSSSWGAVYWQYFEDLDKITGAATPLNLVKKLFVETNSDRGPVLTPVKEGTVLKVGDKIRVRIELRADRDMEYVHMKDMRASCLEPVNVLSGYKWQGGLGYYESTKDASTNFFFNSLRKGTYVFEYPLFVTHAGNFSNGVTSIQCMYAPEFSSHSEGVRISVE